MLILNHLNIGWKHSLKSTKKWADINSVSAHSLCFFNLVFATKTSVHRKIAFHSLKKPLHKKCTGINIPVHSLVDVNGLEPLTLRTSSECSTS